MYSRKTGGNFSPYSGKPSRALPQSPHRETLSPPPNYSGTALYFGQGKKSQPANVSVSSALEPVSGVEMAAAVEAAAPASVEDSQGYFPRRPLDETPPAFVWPAWLEQDDLLLIALWILLLAEEQKEGAKQDDVLKIILAILFLAGKWQGETSESR